MSITSFIAHLDDPVDRIRPALFGHFAEHLGSCIYGGIWVGKDSDIPNEDGIRIDVVEALSQLSPPVIRWPGGCFADDYHWEDGIGPKETRPMRHNLWWDQPEDNSFGTDEYIRFCKMVGTEPYICANVGSGSVEEAKSWLEYCNFDGDTDYTRRRRDNGSPEPFGVKYWGVGNENWGCGGRFDPEDYATRFIQFATYMKRLDNSIETIACGDAIYPRPEWNERLIKKIGSRLSMLDHLAIHQYSKQGAGLEFSDEDHYMLMVKASDLEKSIAQADRILSYLTDGQKKIGIIVDEWGVWHPEAVKANGLSQAGTLRDGLFAASVLNMFMRHADILTMTNIAQTINVLQCVLLTNGPEMARTPTYHVFDMFQCHMDAMAIKTTCSGPKFTTSSDVSEHYLDIMVSKRDDGAVQVTVVNRDLSYEQHATLSLPGLSAEMATNIRVLTSANVRDYNLPGDPDVVNISEGQDMPLSSLKFAPRSLTVFSI